MSASQYQQELGQTRSFKLGDFIRRRPESITFFLLVAICVIVSIINPAFLQASTLIDIGRASVVMGLFALGVFIILAAGGIDVSFTAIAACTVYSLTLLVQAYMPTLPIVFVILMAIAGGVFLGLINGVLVHSLKVPSLIVTIGTQYLFRGFLLAFVGTVWIHHVADADDGRFWPPAPVPVRIRQRRNHHHAVLLPDPACGSDPDLVDLEPHADGPRHFRHGRQQPDRKPPWL